MFTLGREDVFAVDDLGIQQSMVKLYNLKATDKKLLKEKLLKISFQMEPIPHLCLQVFVEMERCVSKGLRGFKGFKSFRCFKRLQIKPSETPGTFETPETSFYLFYLF